MLLAFCSTQFISLLKYISKWLFSPTDQSKVLNEAINLIQLLQGYGVDTNVELIQPKPSEILRVNKNLIQFAVPPQDETVVQSLGLKRFAFKHDAFCSQKRAAF